MSLMNKLRNKKQIVAQSTEGVGQMNVRRYKVMVIVFDLMLCNALSKH